MRNLPGKTIFESVILQTNIEDVYCSLDYLKIFSLRLFSVKWEDEIGRAKKIALMELFRLSLKCVEKQH
jgi:hypothetical protein